MHRWSDMYPRILMGALRPLPNNCSRAIQQFDAWQGTIKSDAPGASPFGHRNGMSSMSNLIDRSLCAGTTYAIPLRLHWLCFMGHGYAKILRDSDIFISICTGCRFRP